MILTACKETVRNDLFDAVHNDLLENAKKQLLTAFCVMIKEMLLQRTCFGYYDFCALFSKS